MKLNRKSFLRQLGVGTTVLAVGAAARGQEPAAPALPAYSERDPEPFWEAVKRQYILTPGFAYFNTGGLGPVAGPILEVSEKAARQLQAKSETGHGLLKPARETIARFLGATPDEIAFVRNATEGNSTVAAGLTLNAGDEVIFESHAHPGGSFPWLNLRKLHGVVVKIFEPDAKDPVGNVARIAALITPRTKVVQVSHVTAPTGIVMPVPDIAALCRQRGVWFHIDGAQSAGMIPISLREIGCDSYTASGHKWLGGPHETGVLFVRKERLDDMRPVLVGAYSSDLADLNGDFSYVATAVRYEYGTRNAAAITALAAAAAAQEKIGRDRVAARGRALAERVRAGLAALPDMEILTPAAGPGSASIITFRTPRVAYDALFGKLLGEYQLRCRPVSEEKLNALRVSTHLCNSPAECDRLVTAMAAILKKT